MRTISHSILNHNFKIKYKSAWLVMLFDAPGRHTAL